jgi:hypothetical protein
MKAIIHVTTQTAARKAVTISGTSPESWSVSYMLTPCISRDRTCKTLGLSLSSRTHIIYRHRNVNTHTRSWEELNRYWERRAPRATQERNLRSKIWWFTEFCNSHYVSHFAAFFIVARTKISIAKSCIFLRSINQTCARLCFRINKIAQIKSTSKNRVNMVNEVL